MVTGSWEAEAFQFLHISLHIHILIDISEYIDVYIYMFVCLFVFRYIYIYICTYLHLCISPNLGGSRTFFCLKTAPSATRPGEQRRVRQNHEDQIKSEASVTQHSAPEIFGDQFFCYPHF